MRALAWSYHVRCVLYVAVVPITRKVGGVVTKPNQADTDEDFSTYAHAPQHAASPIDARANQTCVSLCACVRACVRVCVCLWLCVWLCVAPEELQATMASSLRLPQEKSSFPLTASQEVGCVALAGARD